MIRKLLATAAAALLLPLTIPAAARGGRCPFRGRWLADIPVPETERRTAHRPPADARATAGQPGRTCRVGGDALATHGLVDPGRRETATGRDGQSTWLVADLDTGEVLGACGPHVLPQPGERAEDGAGRHRSWTRLNPNQMMTVVRRATWTSSPTAPPSAWSWAASTRFRCSGSACCSTPATTRRTRWPGWPAGGGEDGVAKTVAAENAFAKSLGAYQTHVVHPSGLDGSGAVHQRVRPGAVRPAQLRQTGVHQVRADQDRADARAAAAEEGRLPVPEREQADLQLSRVRSGVRPASRRPLGTATSAPRSAAGGGWW